MAYQGILAYFYDVIHPNSSVELDVCRWNQVVADVIWRGPVKEEYMGECRDYPAPGLSHKDNTPQNSQCHDCRILPVEETMTVHYTACKKPWECTIPTPRVPNKRNKAHTYRLQQLTNVSLKNSTGELPVACCSLPFPAPVPAPIPVITYHHHHS